MGGCKEGSERSGSSGRSGRLRSSDAGREQAVTRKDIRVDPDKVDKLVDLVGELALAEMMVVQNPALAGLEAEEFDRAGASS